MVVLARGAGAEVELVDVDERKLTAAFALGVSGGVAEHGRELRGGHPGRQQISLGVEPGQLLVQQPGEFRIGDETQVEQC